MIFRCAGRSAPRTKRTACSSFRSPWWPAEAARGAAGGPGGPPRPGRGGPGAPPQDRERIEAGGGLGGVVLPTGAYVVKGGQVRGVPAVDMTLVVVASLTLVRILARTWTRSRRQRGRP